MLTVDSSRLIAARTMGASETRIFLDIYFPQVQPALLGGTVLVLVLALGFFLTPTILGGAQNLTIPVFIQQQVQLFQWGKAAALGVVLLVVSLIGYLIALRIGGVAVLAPMSGGSRGVSGSEPLRLTATTFVCIGALTVSLLILILPLVVVMPTAFTETTMIRFPPVGFTMRWFEEVLTSDIWIGAFLKSVRVGIITASIAIICGLAVARVQTKTRSVLLKLIIQIIAISPLIIPIVLLGIGIFDVQGRLGLIGTDFGLVIAHAVLCLPLTFLVLVNALQAIDGALEEAAWTMGASSLRTLQSVVFPMILPALVGAFGVSFVTSWDEVVIALLQSGLEKTLPVTIYSHLRSGITPVVPAIAMIVTLPVLLGAMFVGMRSILYRNKNISGFVHEIR
jgi:putative spermidine/putrescine transport system permease protein